MKNNYFTSPWAQKYIGPALRPGSGRRRRSEGGCDPRRDARSTRLGAPRGVSGRTLPARRRRRGGTDHGRCCAARRGYRRRRPPSQRNQLRKWWKGGFFWRAEQRSRLICAGWRWCISSRDGSLVVSVSPVWFALTYTGYPLSKLPVFSEKETGNTNLAWYHFPATETFKIDTPR